MMACNNNSSNVLKNEISGKDVHAAFVSDFMNYYRDDYFSRPSDTCILRRYIENEIDSVRSFPVYAFNNSMVFNDEQNSIPFSYAVIKNATTKESFFYGHYDAYKLYDIDTLQIVRFENQGINDLIAKFPLPNESDAIEFLTPYIYNMYYIVWDKKRQIRVPIFPYILTHGQFKNGYRNDSNKDEFDQLFPEEDEKNLLIISNDNLGALIFKVRVSTENTVEVDEFLIAAGSRIPLFKIDVVSQYNQDCKSK
jgi:hypothetical protein